MTRCFLKQTRTSRCPMWTGFKIQTEITSETHYTVILLPPLGPDVSISLSPHKNERVGRGRKRRYDQLPVLSPFQFSGRSNLLLCCPSALLPPFFLRFRLPTLRPLTPVVDTISTTRTGPLSYFLPQFQFTGTPNCHPRDTHKKLSPFTTNLNRFLIKTNEMENFYFGIPI